MEVTMRPALALLLVLSAATAAPLLFPKPSCKADAAPLQGEWEAIHGRIGGGEVDGCRLTLRVKGHRLSFFVDGEWDTTWDVTLDLKATPSRISLGLVAAPEPPPSTTLLGVFRREGDTLTLCFADKRPTDLKGHRDGEESWVFKRKR
jgi:uncharacterized protein (TIGR03067 family)